MTKEQVWEAVNGHNAQIDDYICNDLPREMQQNGVRVTKDRKIPLGAWFKANALIEEQHFYSKAMVILNAVRAEGFDVKIDMQSYKLVWYGGMIK